MDLSIESGSQDVSPTSPTIDPSDVVALNSLHTFELFEMNSPPPALVAIMADHMGPALIGVIDLDHDAEYKGIFGRK